MIITETEQEIIDLCEAAGLRVESVVYIAATGRKPQWLATVHRVRINPQQVAKKLYTAMERLQTPTYGVSWSTSSEASYDEVRFTEVSA